VVGGGYFAARGASVLRGRAFGLHDKPAPSWWRWLNQSFVNLITISFEISRIPAPPT
jgi:hypothetical protein